MAVDAISSSTFSEPISSAVVPAAVAAEAKSEINEKQDSARRKLNVGMLKTVKRLSH